MSKTQIDTILLDLGGVIIDVDYTRTAQEFAELGHGDFDALYSKAKQSSLFDDFETGQLSSAGFCDQVRALVSKDLTDLQIINAWNAMLGSVPTERLELIERLKTRYQVLLLSNTNAIHIPAFEHILHTENGITDFKKLFEGAYYSCEIGLRKPNSNAFHYVLKRHNADPSKTLFIDDSKQHVQGALEAGLHATHLQLEKEDVVLLAKRVGLIA